MDRQIKPFFKPLGYAAAVIAMSAGAQLAARGMTDENARFAVYAWLLLTSLSAAVLGVRHLLSRSNSGQVAD